MEVMTWGLSFCLSSLSLSLNLLGNFGGGGTVLAPLSLLIDFMLSIFSERVRYDSETSWLRIMGLSLKPTQLFLMSELGWMEVAEAEGLSVYLTIMVTS